MRWVRATNHAVLTVIASPPVILVQPSSQEVGFGRSATFRVIADGTMPLTYQWRFEDVDLPDATNSVLVLEQVKFNQFGNYSVRVSNALGSTISSNAILTMPQIVAWGRNDLGQTDVPAGLGKVVAVAAGANYSLALRADGTVAAWGWDSDGQTDVPAGLNDVVAVAAGGSHSLALRADGTMVAWGQCYISGALCSDDCSGWSEERGGDCMRLESLSGAKDGWHGGCVGR